MENEIMKQKNFSLKINIYLKKEMKIKKCKKKLKE